MTEDELLTVKEVAARLKVNRVTVRRWLESGKLHGLMLGGTRLGYRILASEVDRLIFEATNKRRAEE